MADQLHFDYYYGLEGEQFQFIRIPKLLVQDKVFQGLSDRAKILYGIMLDRMSNSRKNKWLDKQNRVYILFSIKKVSEALNCSQPTACKAMAELDSEHGIGLIERRKRGQGKPDIIYVKNFISYVENNPNVGKEKAWDPDDVEGLAENEEDAEDAEDEVIHNEIKNLEAKDSNSLNSKILNSRNFISGEQESLSLGIKGFAPNNTELSNTENSNTESYLISSQVNIKKPDIWLYPFLPEERMDVIRQMQMEPDTEHIPTVVLDLTEMIPRITRFRARSLVEERNGIPKELAFDVPQMTFVIKALTGWNDYIEICNHDYPEEYVLVLKCLIEMCCTLKTMHFGEYAVSYSNVIDQLNRIIHLDKAKYACCTMSSFVDCCIRRYRDASEERKIQIPSNYMKSIIWSAFSEFKTEFEAYVRRTQYQLAIERLQKEDADYRELGKGGLL